MFGVETYRMRPCGMTKGISLPPLSFCSTRLVYEVWAATSELKRLGCNAQTSDPQSSTPSLLEHVGDFAGSILFFEVFERIPHGGILSVEVASAGSAAGGARHRD